MSYEIGTTHYNLPQTTVNDKRSWIDTNESFAKVDADLWSAKETTESNAEALQSVQEDIAGLKEVDVSIKERVSSLEGRVSASEQAITRLTIAIADARQDFKDAICAYDEGSAQLSTRGYQVGDFFWYNDTLYKATAVINVGDTIVPNTNCDTTTITAELMA